MTSTGNPAPPAAVTPEQERKRSRQTKAQPLGIYPKLPKPTGAEVEALRLRMNWTLDQVAELIDLYDGAAVKSIESGKRKINNARWTMMLLAANRHPTLKLVPADTAQPSEQPLP